MATLLVQHLQGLAHEDAISSIVITGSGRPFCADGDLHITAVQGRTGQNVTKKEAHSPIAERAARYPPGASLGVGAV
jgi:enoyl-CoA hydratase/carnithine racemase